MHPTRWNSGTLKFTAWFINMSQLGEFLLSTLKGPQSQQHRKIVLKCPNQNIVNERSLQWKTYNHVRRMNMCIQTKTSGKGSNKVHKPIIINLDLRNDRLTWCCELTVKLYLRMSRTSFNLLSVSSGVSFVWKRVILFTNLWNGVWKKKEILLQPPVIPAHFNLNKGSAFFL